MRRCDRCWWLCAGALGALLAATACGGRSTSLRDGEALSGTAADGTGVSSAAQAPGTNGSGALGGGGTGGTRAIGTGGAAPGGSVRIPVGGGSGGTGGTGGSGGSTGPRVDSDAFAACNEACQREPSGCGGGSPRDFCHERCEPLREERPGCAAEIQGYVDCVANERELARMEGCAHQVEDQCDEQYAAINDCAGLCELSETIDEYSCHYVEACQGGNYESYCWTDGASDAWTCTCFSGGRWHGEQSLTAGPAEDACLLGWCEFIVPPT